VRIRQTCLPDVQKQIHEVLQSSGDMFTSHTHNILQMIPIRDKFEIPFNPLIGLREVHCSIKTAHSSLY
jgi:hypothetical protein